MYNNHSFGAYWKQLEEMLSMSSINFLKSFCGDIIKIVILVLLTIFFLKIFAVMPVGWVQVRHLCQ